MEEQEIEELSQIFFYEFQGSEYQVFRLEVLDHKIKNNDQRIEQAQKIMWNKNEVLLAKIINLLEKNRLDLVEEIFTRALRLYRKKELQKLSGIDHDFGE